MPPALETLLSPMDHLPTPPPPSTPSVSVCRPNSLLPPLLLSPTPSSHIPLSRAAAVHKYINLVSAYVCVLRGRRHIDNGPFHVSPDHRRSVFTHQIHPDTRSDPLPHSAPVVSPRICQSHWKPEDKGWESTWRWWCQTGSLIPPTAADLMGDTTAGQRSRGP